MSQTTDLVQIEEQLKRELAGLKDQVDAPSSNRISCKGKMFRIPGGQTHPGPMRVIVLDFIGMNQYWATAYNPNTRAPADCQAIGRILRELEPIPANSPKQQAKSCEACTHNKFGSGPSGKGKACKNQRKLLIVAPDFTEKTQPMTLIVSPTGISGWDKYVRDLASDHGAMPVQMITEISFDPNRDYPTLLFKLPEDQPKHAKLGLAMHLRAKYQEMLVVEDAKEAEAA